jgi:hypothetical protein
MVPEWLSGIRPVDVKFDVCGRLLVSSDGSYEDQDGRMIILIQSAPQATVPSPAASGAFTTACPAWIALALVACMVSISANMAT